MSVKLARKYLLVKAVSSVTYIIVKVLKDP